MRHWRPALRMARRGLWNHKIRTLLTMLCVALPVLVATVIALTVHNNRWTNEAAAQQEMGDADATVIVTQFTSIRPREALWGDGVPTALARHQDGGTKGRPVKRDPAEVDLAALLPAGSTATPVPVPVTVPLDTGGNVWGMVLDPASELASVAATFDGTRLPVAPDEVAVTEALAHELGMLDDDGGLASDAALKLDDGTSLRVVATFDNNPSWDGGQAFVAAPLGSVLTPDIDPTYQDDPRLLVDMPDLALPELKALTKELAANGVAMRPRDAVIHPGRWGQGPREQRPPVDVGAVVAGTVAILFGLVEVVLLVGAALAVGARRQVRDLGLFIAGGGGPADVRRILVAQGIVIGLPGALLGAAVGTVVSVQASSLVGRLTSRPQYTDGISWAAVVVIAVLGVLTAVIAALLPAWSMSRLTPVQALSGRFPIRPGESRAHRPAFWLASAGAVLMVLGGWWTTKVFPRPARDSMVSQSVPPIVTGIGMVVMVAGVVWATPYLVRVLATLGRGLPLSGRYSFRDAGRHRFRTAAAASTLTVTVAGAVLAGFGVDSVLAHSHTEGHLPPHSAAISVDMTSPVAQQTVERLIGPIHVTSARAVKREGGTYGALFFRQPGNDDEIRAVDDATLAKLVRPADLPAAQKMFDAGGVVTSSRSVPADGRLGVWFDTGKGRAAQDDRWELPVVRAEATVFAGEMLGKSWISADTVAGLGLTLGDSRSLIEKSSAFTQSDLDLLQIYGFNGWSDDIDRAKANRLVWAAVAVAGLLAAIIAGIAVALAAAEGSADTATLAAVGAGPARRRGFGAMHGLFLGLVGGVLGLAVGGLAGMAFTQVDGLPGIGVPWQTTACTLIVVVALSAVAGWLVTPRRLALSRRTT